MEKLRKFFAKHSLKIASLLLAIVLWVIANNAYNPKRSETFPVNLTIKNEEALSNNGYILANKDELLNKKLSIKVKNTEQRLLDLKKVSDQIVAEIDLKPIDILTSNTETDYTITINYRLPTSFDDESIYYKSDSFTNIILDSLAKRRFPVTVTEVGEPEEGYIKSKSVTNPESVLLSGAKTIIDKVKAVYVEIDLEGRKSDFVTSKTIHIVDENGDSLNDSLVISTSSAQIETSIYKIGKASINPPTFTGNVLDGYVITNVTIKPEFIEIVGNENSIDSFTNIDLDTVDITGKSETFSQTFDLNSILKENNVKLSYDGETDVAVTFKIEKIETAEFSIPVTQIEFKHNVELPYNITPNITTITIEATKDVLDNFNVGNVKGTADISELELGTHEVIPNIILPDEVILIGSPTPLTITIFPDPTSIEEGSNANLDNDLDE